MNPLTWDNPFTETHLVDLDNLGIIYIAPLKYRLPNGDYGGTGAMAEPSDICSTVERVFSHKLAKQAN